MQSSLIPWHVFMNALAEQQCAPMENWLDRWRFDNDGVFMAHDLGGARAEIHLADGTVVGGATETRIIN